MRGVVCGMAIVLAATASSARAVEPAVVAPVSVGTYALVERAPVPSGFAPFVIEAGGLLPGPRKREDFTPTEDQLTYPLHRTAERMMGRKDSPIGWSRSPEASFSFATEFDRFPPTNEGMVYAVEGELALHGNGAIPLGLRLSRAAGDGRVPLRYSVGLIVADQILMTRDGVLEDPGKSVVWMLSLRPDGPDAAVPVRAVFAVRAESDDVEAGRRALKGLSAAIVASSDGRVAVAERAKDAAEWLKPLPMYLHPEQMGAPPKAEGDGKKSDKKADKKAEKKTEGEAHH